MITIALYSNDSHFFSGFGRRLAAELRSRAPSFCRFRSFPISQTSLFGGPEKPPELCIVDLRDDPVRDLQFAASLRQNAATEVMAVAPSPAYAMASYDADLLSYFVDPPDPVRAAGLILRRFARALQTQEAQFSFRTASGVQILAAQRIVYVEYSNHRMLVYTDMGQKLITNTMRLSFAEAASQLLADSRFVRTHASFIVNVMHVSEFGQSVLQMDTGVSVPVSHARHKEVKEHFQTLFSRQSSL